MNIRFPLILAVVLPAVLLATPRPWAPYAEPQAPLLTSVVDLRSAAKGRADAAVQVVVRGVILRLADGWCVCFDPDLLRVAAIWRAAEADLPLTEEGIAAKSYQNPKGKADGGTKALPAPLGSVIFLGNQLPGAWAGSAACPADPRPACPSAEETGRGPLPISWGQYLATQLTETGASLRYRVGGVDVVETWALAATGIVRKLHLSGQNTEISVLDAQNAPRVLSATPQGSVHEILYLAEIPQATNPPRKLDFSATMLTKAALGAEMGGYHTDSLALPVENPWKRNVRPSGIDFFPDGRAAICTLDGDVWLATGLVGDLQAVRWQRYATGLHEPQSIQVVGDRLFVFTKQGIEELLPSKDGSHAAAHSLFCDAFPHSADTREFAADMVKRPGGGFFIAKGGQQLTRKGISAGRIFSVSSDGKQVEEYANGLRQPYLGMNAQTGLLTATDQQGHWVPATPVHVVTQGGYYGFPEAIAGKPPGKPSEPALWFPHEVNQSAGGQVWCHSPAMGELNGCLLHLGFYKSAMFKVMLGKDQSAAVPLGLEFPIPLLKAATNPLDGFLYACGLQIWGSDAPKITGIVRLRPGQNQKPALPKQITAHTDGLWIEFPFAIDPACLTAENFTLESWDYLRSKQYGSPPIAQNGKPGRNEHAIRAFELSAEGRQLFLHTLAPLAPRMTLRLSYTAISREGQVAKNLAVITATQLRGADFSKTHPNSLHKAVEASQSPKSMPMAKGDAAEGRKLVEMLGCLACHSTNGSMEGMKGPSWKGLLGSEVELVKGGDKATVDRAYLEEAILHPSKKVRRGFDNGDIGMPSYEGILTGSKLESVLLYLESLK